MGGSPDYIKFYHKTAERFVDMHGKWCQNTECLFGMVKKCDICPKCSSAAELVLETDLVKCMENDNKYKPCVSCGKYAEKNSGCNHITCSFCRAEWCWKCLQIYKKNEKGKYIIEGHYANPDTPC